MPDIKLADTHRLEEIHNWLSVSGSSEMLPALPHTADRTPPERRSKTLTAVDWLGDVPTALSARGTAFKIPGWTELAPTANEVRQWATEGLNVLCQHRWLRGIRLHGLGASERFLELQRRVEDFTRLPFRPPMLIAPGGSITFVLETPVTYLPTRHTPKASLLGSGALSVVAGVDQYGRAYRSWADPNSWGAPQVTAKWFAHLWFLASGQKLQLPDLQATAARMAIVGTDPLAKRIEADGWALGFRKEGMEVRCPFHPNAFTPALYSPAPKAGGRPRLVCPLCRRGVKLEQYVQAMGA